MPKVGQEPVRRAALIDATIAEIGRSGSLDVTVSQIARSAGMSSALAHHYFGSKNQIFLAAMREILTRLRSSHLAELRRTPGDRSAAIIRASFDAEQFDLPVMRAWMTFYGMALAHDEARRLLLIYQSRLRSNLRYAFGPERAAEAERAASLIDGRYLRAIAMGQSLDLTCEVALILGEDR